MELQKKILEHKRNKYIEFDKDSHTYTYYKKLRPKTPVTFEGVTSLIADHCAPFERDKIAYFTAKRDGVEVEDVLELWNKDREYGNSIHDAIEDLINDGVYLECDELKSFLSFLEEYELEPVIGEWVIYDENIERASAVDIVCVNKRNEIVVVDLKTMKKPIKMTPYRSKTKTMDAPFDDVLDASYWKYSLQVSMYKYWIKHNYNLPVSNVNYILHINKDYKNVLPVVDLEPQIDTYYKYNG